MRACLPVCVLVRERASERVRVWIGGRGVAIGLLPEAVGNVDASITNLHALMRVPSVSTLREYLPAWPIPNQVPAGIRSVRSATVWQG